jgi:hypothetical protein
LALREEHVGIFSIFFGHRLQELQEKMLLMQKNLKKFTSYKNYTPIVSGSYNVYKERHKIIFKILDDIQSPNVYRIYPDKFFCNTSIINRCVGNNSEQLFYYDNNHLSIAGSKFIVDEISKTIEKIVPNK